MIVSMVLSKDMYFNVLDLAMIVSMVLSKDMYFNVLDLADDCINGVV